MFGEHGIMSEVEPHDTSHSIELVLNGAQIRADVPADLLLIHLLRDRVGLTGTKNGCGVGVCGSCSVVVDGRLVSACLVPAVQLNGRNVMTIEGAIRVYPAAETVVAAFASSGGVQCGFCSPGQVMAALDFLDRYPTPDRATVVGEFDANLCRCTGYYAIIESVLEAAGRLADAP